MGTRDDMFVKKSINLKMTKEEKEKLDEKEKMNESINEEAKADDAGKDELWYFVYNHYSAINISMYLIVW